MYVDDSGDPGANVAVTDKFILTALVIHESKWNDFMDALSVFRKHLRDTKSLKMREEIHAVEFVNGRSIRPSIKAIKRNDRLDILKQVLDWLASRTEISVFSVVVDKTRHMSDDIYEIAWKTLIQRFENTIGYSNFPDGNDTGDMGIVISDRSDEKKLTGIIRAMRVYNPVTNQVDVFGSGYRNLALKYIIEDPNFRDSDNSYILQMVDVAAYFTLQRYHPNTYVRKKGAKNFFNRLSPVLNQYVKTGGGGIVET